MLPAAAGRVRVRQPCRFSPTSSATWLKPTARAFLCLAMVLSSTSLSIVANATVTAWFRSPFLNTVGRGSIKERLHLFRDQVGKFLVHRKLAMRQLDGLDARDGYER